MYTQTITSAETKENNRQTHKPWQNECVPNAYNCTRTHNIYSKWWTNSTKTPSPLPMFPPINSVLNLLMKPTGMSEKEVENYMYECWCLLLVILLLSSYFWMWKFDDWSKPQTQIQQFHAPYSLCFPLVYHRAQEDHQCTRNFGQGHWMTNKCTKK